jgi:hypothetical protein
MKCELTSCQLLWSSVRWILLSIDTTKLCSFLLWYFHFCSVSIKMRFVRCLFWCSAVHVFLARLREVMERMLLASVEGSVTAFVGSVYKTETHNHMWVNLQWEVSAGKFVGSVLRFGEWKLPINPSSGLAERQNTQCHYASIGITYVTLSWATADCERAILGPRNSAVYISREVVQLLLDIKEYRNQVDTVVDVHEALRRQRPGIAGVSVNLIDQPIRIPSIELHWTVSFISSWQFYSLVSEFPAFYVVCMSIILYMYAVSRKSSAVRTCSVSSLCST